MIGNDTAMVLLLADRQREIETLRINVAERDELVQQLRSHVDILNAALSEQKDVPTSAAKRSPSRAKQAAS